jgi:high affinity cGMP-specific 3',5'-cyclic phosphodiesterase 9
MVGDSIHEKHLTRLQMIKSELSVIAENLEKSTDNKSSDEITSGVKLTMNSTDVSIPSNLFTWDFNSMELTEVPRLHSVIMKLVESLPSLPEGLNLDTLGSYVKAVSCTYNLVPFHNFQHATCVTHALYMFMKETNVHTYLDTARTFGLLLSAIVHDVDHPGHTNTFEVNTGSELAAIYNDKSVLENHHCSTAFRLMRRNDCGVLTSLSVNDARDVRKAVVAAVLATDMAVHFQMAGEMAQKAPKSGAKLQYDEEGDKLFLCSIFLHAADLSNPYRRFDLTQAWARRVAEEFNNQISREKEMGLPYLPYMETPDEMALCRNEIGFGTHVVMPYVKNLAVLFPELSYIQSNLSDNIEKWKSLLTDLKTTGSDGVASDK